MGLLLGSNIGPAVPIIVLAAGVIYYRRRRGEKPPNSNA